MNGFPVAAPWRRPTLRACVAGLVAVLALLAPAGEADAGTLPTGFQESVVFDGLTNPMVIRFAPDGRVFVGEKSGLIKVFGSLSDTSPTIFADLRTNVYNFWDRGLLGLALDPQFPADPYVYVLYAFDADIGGAAPKWGAPGATSDPCPSPPGPTADGCVISARLSRLEAGGDVWTGAESVLVEDWCQQYPSHSVGQLQFGPDGALYASGGDGASFNFVDYGQDGNPTNPCGDPPGGVGATLSPPTAEGGALRSQDVRTSGDPVSLDGSIIRIDPDTGAALPDNPNAFASDPNERRIIAHGFRNPFRFTVRPGTDELWIGDVGWNDWEEVNRLADPLGTVENFGWPCYEGNLEQDGYDGANVDICENLYAEGAGAVRTPFFTYNHTARVVSGESCPTGSSSLAGIAFYEGGNYPGYNGALFFADYSRDCIWAMFEGASGVPDPATRITFDAGAANPVDIEIGPAGDLFYVDFDGGTIRRIQFFSGNQPPTAVASANPTSGTAPLTVDFDGTASSDPDAGDTLSFEWDLDGDGAYDDSTAAQPTFTYTTPAAYTVRMRVTDGDGASAVDTLVINANGTPPTATIATPSAGTTWRVGDVIAFSGSATDADEGTLPASALSWSLVIHHCPSNCHTHPIQEFAGVAGGSFTAPDHEYPSHLELRLTATDSSGLENTASVLLFPDTVDLTFESVPSGLELTVGGTSTATPFTRTVIPGSANSIIATTPQVLDGETYEFASWSDGGAQTHTVVAPAAPATYTATYEASDATPVPGLVAAYSFDIGAGTLVRDASGHGNDGTISGALWSSAGKYGSALSFNGVNSWVTVPDAPSLDLTSGMTLEAWVRPAVLGTGWRTVLFKEQPGNLVYGLYANRSSRVPVAQVDVGGVQDVNGTTQLQLDAWSHLAATYDGATLRLYVNGVEAGIVGRPGGILTSAGVLHIGGNSVWPEWFNGLIDEVRVYDRPLSQAEIQADMNTSVGVPDSEAPGVPGNVRVTGSSAASLSLGWDAASDNVGVAGYRLYLDGVEVATSTGLEHTFVGLSCSSSYELGVAAEDAAGNLSAVVAVSGSTGECDTTAPTVSLTAPAAGATVSGSVQVSADAADNDGVVGVRFLLDGAPLGAEDVTVPYSVSWNTGLVGNGSHTLTAVARDPSGNTTMSAAVGVTVENTAPPPVGLVGAYSFDAGAGSALADVSGSGNHGAISGASWAGAGKYGGALSFDGVDDRVTIADAPSLDLTTGMTLEAWVRPSALGTAWRTVLFKEQPGNLVYGLYANRSSRVPVAQAVVGGGVRDANGAAQLPADAWSHLAATYDGSALRLYVNGTQVGVIGTGGSIATSSGVLHLGGNAVWGEWFTGLIDEVRIYNRALSQTEIQTDMNTSVGVPDTTPPSAPADLAKTGGGATTIAVSWTASTDDVLVAGYRLYRDGSQVASTTGTTHTFGGLTCNTSYDLGVEAHDVAGNTSPRTLLVASTEGCDTTPPTVSVTDPSGGSTVFNTIAVSATAADDDIVAGVQFKLDGADLGAEDTTAPYTISWNTRTAANGPHTLTAVARDGSGNVSTSAPVSVTIDNAAAPPPGLVAAYGFDEASGGTVADASGSGNDGTISGAGWASIGRFGGALSFDGVDDWVTVADASSLDLTSGMTLEAWVAPDALGDAWRTVVLKERSSNIVYDLYANRNTRVPTAEAWAGGTVRTADGGSQLPVGAWAHLAATYDGSVLRLYVNGTEARSLAAPGGIGTSTGPLRIGGNSIWGEFFAGLIDEVRLYNRPLSAAEIQADMAAAVERDTSAPTVVSTGPAADATDVKVGTTVTADFGEAMQPASIDGQTVQLFDPNGDLVPATVSYDELTGRAALAPADALLYGAQYTVTVRGGPTDPRAKDRTGNALAADHTWSFTTEPPPPPVLVVTTTANPFSDYTAEILRAEGLNAFTTIDVSRLTPAFLDFFDVIVLGQMPLTPSDVTMLTDWVDGGGNLVAMRPDKQLAGLLGLTDTGQTLADGYMLVNTTGPPGAGIVGETIQFHGAADRYTAGGATTVATLYSSATAATASPAVTMRDVGASGGQAAAFAYDLARSVVLTRQGNPAWVGQDRDGVFPIRTNDLFFGGSETDWIDLGKVAIPQADEQQRLLVNLILAMSRDRTPLPRFWYFPRGEKAAIVMTGDDHAQGGTAGRFEQYIAASPAGCSVADWECVRGTSYVYPSSPLTDAQAAPYAADGFEVALHVNVGGGPCNDWTPASLEQDYNEQSAAFAAKYPSLPAPETERTHCVSWTDWATQPKVERDHGIRLDTNFYYYPASWIDDRPGFMTGSGMAMRFADLDGSVIDVYQAHTHMTDESGQTFPFNVNSLLDRALGSEGYYGFFVANMHTDLATSPGSDAIVASALARDVPVITAKQLLDWVDARDGSSFKAFSWDGSTVGFRIDADPEANGLQAMLPVQTAAGTLNALARAGSAVTYTTETVKGVQYAVFSALAGDYSASYGS